jgi:hypothetical protein
MLDILCKHFPDQLLCLTDHPHLSPGYQLKTGYTSDANETLPKLILVMLNPRLVMPSLMTETHRSQTIPLINSSDVIARVLGNIRGVKGV